MFDTSCPDWVERLKTGRPLVPDLPLFEKERDLALRVFKRLRIPDVPGTPKMAEANGEWLFAIVAAIFGSLDVETAKRLIREVFLLIPKKNAKTTNAGGMLLTAAILNRRPLAELQLVAPSKNIADISFGQIEGMINLDPDLRKIFRVRNHIKTIEDLRNETRAEIRVLAADTDVVTGTKAAYTLIDETHEFAKKKNASQVFTELRGALAAREDGFLIQITTQSKEPPTGVFKRELEIARDVRDGKLKLPLLPVLYELPRDDLKDNPDLWKDRRTWGWVNPNLGRSVSEQYLADELTKAERSTKEDLALLASQHFNVEIGVNLHAGRWSGVDFWQQCENPALTLETLLERCDVVVAGVDGGGLDDLFGLCIRGRTEDGRTLVWFHAWAHKIVLERYPEHEQKFRDFEDEGSLTITDYRWHNMVVDENGEETGEVASTVSVDLTEMVSYIEQARDSGKLAKIGFDPYGIKVVVEALEGAEFDREEWMVWVSQGYKLQGMIKTDEMLLSVGSIEHDGSAMMNWCVGNARVEKKGNAVVLTKQASEGKIDPLMAMFTAGEVMATNPEPQGAVEIFAI